MSARNAWFTCSGVVNTLVAALGLQEAAAAYSRLSPVCVCGTLRSSPGVTALGQRDVRRAQASWLSTSPKGWDSRDACRDCASPQSLHIDIENVGGAHTPRLSERGSLRFHRSAGLAAPSPRGRNCDYCTVPARPSENPGMKRFASWKLLTLVIVLAWVVIQLAVVASLWSYGGRTEEFLATF